MTIRILSICMAVLILSCSKDKDGETPDPEPPTNPPAGVTKGVLTELTFTNNGAAMPTTVSMRNKAQPLPGFRAKADGNVQIKFFGKDGRDILQGNARGLSSNMATWDIGNQDTLRIYKAGQLKYEYVFSNDDGLNAGVRFTSVTESEAQAKTRLNNYVKNDMPNQKFEQP